MRDNLDSIDPLTTEERASFCYHFEKSVMLTNAEASALLAKIHGPLKDDFNNSPDNSIYRFTDMTGFYFYRHSNRPEKYIWLHFGINGKFSNRTSGVGDILPWQNHGFK